MPSDAAQQGVLQNEHRQTVVAFDEVASVHWFWLYGLDQSMLKSQIAALRIKFKVIYGLVLPRCKQ